MRSQFAGIRTLTLPWGAPAGTPRIVLGPDVPSELTSYYGDPSTAFGIVAAIVYYSNTVGIYYYEGVLNGAGAKTVRGYVINGVVIEMGRRSATGATTANDWIGYDAAVGIDTVFGANGGGGSGLFNFQTGPDGGLTIHGKKISGQRAKLNQGAGTGNTTSVTYVDLPGSPSVNFTKRYSAASTSIEVELAIGSYASAAGIGLDFGVLINGVDTTVTHFFHNPGNEHQMAVGAEDITGLADGTYTIKPRWRSSAGGQINQDNNDWISLRAHEVPA